MHGQLTGPFSRTCQTSLAQNKTSSLDAPLSSPPPPSADILAPATMPGTIRGSDKRPPSSEVQRVEYGVAKGTLFPLCPFSSLPMTTTTLNDRTTDRRGVRRPPFDKVVRPTLTLGRRTTATERRRRRGGDHPYDERATTKMRGPTSVDDRPTEQRRRPPLSTTTGRRGDPIK